jgi:hypothetical protein
MCSANWLIRTSTVAGIALLLGACSGPSEDVRVTFCKDIATAMVPTGVTITWDEPTFTISRPSHAITQLTFATEDAQGTSQAEVACWFKFEREGHSASAVANPIEEYATLPYAMTFNNRELSAGELKKLVNAEQLRRGGALIDTLQKGAKDMADQVRAGIGG